MPWTENKRLKITVKREKPKAQDLIVEFEIDDAHREDFHRTLQYALAACATAGAEFTFNEIVDLESKEVTTLEVIMTGPQKAIGEAFQKNARGLQSNAVWMR